MALRRQSAGFWLQPAQTEASAVHLVGPWLYLPVARTAISSAGEFTGHVKGKNRWHFQAFASLTVVGLAESKT